MDPKIIKQDAKAALEYQQNAPRKLALLHTGVIVIFSLLTTLVSFLLDQAVSSAGGLSGIALRSALETGQVVLSLAGTILIPFWQISFVFAALQISRKQTAGPDSLLEGFRQWGKVLRMNILLTLVAIFVMLACSYGASIIFMVSPMSDKIYTALEPLMTTDITELTPQMEEMVLSQSGWLFGILGGLLILIGLPVLYRYRMCQFSLMDGGKGARHAINRSKLLSIHNRMEMFRFDLSFWWYYLGLSLLSSLANITSYLEIFGISLPISNNVLFWVFYLLSLAAQLLFAYFFSPYYYTSCALYYERMKDRFLTPVNPPPTPFEF